MGFLDKLKEKASEASTAISASAGNKSYEFTFSKIPESLEELNACEGSDLAKPEQTAALFMLALCEYVENPDMGIQMINALKGPEDLSTYEMQFLKEHLSDKKYLPKSYFAGTSPANNYTPTFPLKITVSENAYSRSEESKGYVRMWLKSSGADHPREITLRYKPSDKMWFVNGFPGGLLSGIRIPAAEDKWA